MLNSFRWRLHLHPTSTMNEYAREAFEITDSADVSTQALSAYHGALNKLIEPVAPSGTIKQTDYSEERNPFVAQPWRTRTP